LDPKKETIKGMRAFAEDSLDQSAHMPDTLRDDDPELTQDVPEMRLRASSAAGSAAPARDAA
jgi:hypothetical protein